jgi:DNA-binding NarL/FixJ family response regulator
VSAVVDRPRRARVLIAAENAPTRVGLRLALQAEAVCTEAVDSESAVAAAVRDRPDVCLLDFETPGRGLRAVSEIVARVPNVLVIVLSRRVEEDEFLAAVHAGASGYLPHAVDPARLPHVVRSVMRGEAAVPRHFVTKLIDDLRGQERRHRSLVLSGDRRVELTSREWEVIELLRQGLTTREIATELHISQVTVRRHLSSAYVKLGVDSRSAAIRMLTLA